MTTLLAGDIGGTKTLLSLYGLEPDNQLNLIYSQRYRSADWASLEPMLQAFLADTADRAERPAAGDPLGQEALALWLAAYGSVTGDLALASLSRGGIWLAGGTAGKLLDSLRSPAFLEAFAAKGRLQAVLDPMPIMAVIDPAIGSFSAACRARMLMS